MFFVFFQHTPEEVNGQCGCYHGYYGSACEMQCAGGANYPCFGKGECNTETGTCQCDPSANVNDNCSVCNDGWFGEDCSVAYSGLQGTASTSVLYNGIVRMLKQSRISKGNYCI